MVAPTHGGPVAVEVLGYHVLMGNGLIDRLGEICRRLAPAYRYAIITDDQVAPHWMTRVEMSFSVADAASTATIVPAGEGSKTREWWAGLTDWLLSQGAGRDTTIVALGGGVIGDLAGFVAATFMRGVPVVQVPTTLLAMVDASIGGKTAVDTPAGKNLVGAFHQPAAVVVDPGTLATLPDVWRRAGMAEVLKHGAIADAEYFDAATRWAAAVEDVTRAGRRFDWLAPQSLGVIGRSVEIKAAVVRADPHERGQRQVLNAGHTVAHALERETGFSLLHGQAVAIGLVVEAVLGERAGVTRPGTADRLRSALGASGLPIGIPRELDAARLLEAMRTDKKVRGDRIAFALLREIGAVAGSEDGSWTTVVPESLVLEVLGDPSLRGA